MVVASVGGEASASDPEQNCLSVTTFFTPHNRTELHHLLELPSKRHNSGSILQSPTTTQQQHNKQQVCITDEHSSSPLPRSIGFPLRWKRQSHRNENLACPLMKVKTRSLPTLFGTRRIANAVGTPRRKPDSSKKLQCLKPESLLEEQSMNPTRLS